jgi:antitoxin component YwqK of YwqJK toxin-antitoxin module
MTTILDLPKELGAYISSLSVDPISYRNTLLSNTFFGKWLLPEQRKCVKRRFLRKIHEEEYYGGLEISKRYHDYTVLPDGRKHGKYKITMWGDIVQKKKYFKDNLHGPYKEWYQNKQIRISIHYFHGEQTGISESYRENGELSSKGSYVKGKNDGLWFYIYICGGSRGYQEEWIFWDKGRVVQRGCCFL